MPRTKTPEIDKLKERVLTLENYEVEALFDYLKLLIEVRRADARRDKRETGEGRPGNR